MSGPEALIRAADEALYQAKLKGEIAAFHGILRRSRDLRLNNARTANREQKLPTDAFPTSQRPDTLCGLLFLQLVPLLTKPIDFIEHPLQESFSGHGRYPRPFKLKYFLSVTDDLDAHVLDFGTNVI